MDRLLTCAILVTLVPGCTKDRPRSTERNAPETLGSAPDQTTSAEPALPAETPSAPPRVIDTPDRPECPNTETWSKLTNFAPECGYAFSQSAATLPAPPEWEPCESSDLAPASACKKLKRNARMRAFAVGIGSTGNVQIGFVEECQRDQIVVADVEGPTRLALRTTGDKPLPSMCQMKILAVDLDHWFGAFGGERAPANPSLPGYSLGGAFVGGKINEEPRILHRGSTEPFHVATTQGSILPEGWTADGKRRFWNGKPLPRPRNPLLSRLTQFLLAGEETGIHETTEDEPRLILPVPPDRKFVFFSRRDKHLVWQEVPKRGTMKTCALITGEVSKNNRLAKARRLAEIPSTDTGQIVGCDSALLRHDKELLLVSLVNGSLRRLVAPGYPLAVSCKEAFVEHHQAILRVDLSAFGPSKIPALPPVELTLQSPN